METHGEEEARRRRQEERELQYDRNELPTSEVEELQEEERDANPEIIPVVYLRTAKKIE